MLNVLIFGVYWDSTFPNLCFFFLFFRVAPPPPWTCQRLPSSLKGLAESESDEEQAVSWSNCAGRRWFSGGLVERRPNLKERILAVGNCPSIIHGSVKNGCISNTSYCYFQMYRHFSLNHDYGRKSSISSYKLDFHEFSRVKHSFLSAKIGEKQLRVVSGVRSTGVQTTRKTNAAKTDETNRWPNSIFQLFLSHFF